MNKFLRMKGRVIVYCLGRGVGGEGRTILGDHMVFQGERRWDQSSPTEYKRKGGSTENLLPTSEDHKNNYYRAL